MPTRDPLAESFTIEPHGTATALVRHAVPKRSGRPYHHTCPLAAFEAVAHAVEEAGASGFTGETLVAATGLPHTQVMTALAFLRERGIVEQRFPRRMYAVGDDVHLDAMTEYHALREEPKTAD